MDTPTTEVEKPMGMQERPDDPVTHKQLYDKMVAHEKRFNQIMTLAASTTIPMMVAAFIWVWSTHAAQAAFNAGMQVRVENTTQTYEEARNAQLRVETRLDEINRFLREDSRELRDQLNAHIREAKGR